MSSAPAGTTARPDPKTIARLGAKAPRRFAGGAHAMTAPASGGRRPVSSA